MAEERSVRLNPPTPAQLWRSPNWKQNLRTVSRCVPCSKQFPIPELFLYSVFSKLIPVSFFCFASNVLLLYGFPRLIIAQRAPEQLLTVVQKRHI